MFGKVLRLIKEKQKLSRFRKLWREKTATTLLGRRMCLTWIKLLWGKAHMDRFVL